MDSERNDTQTYRAVGNTLLWGLLLSVAVMVLGLILVAASGASASTVIPLDRIVDRLFHGSASAVLDLGILLLFATPLAAVLVAFLSFVREGDRPFVLITGVLMVILVIGFAVALR